MLMAVSLHISENNRDLCDIIIYKSEFSFLLNSFLLKKQQIFIWKKWHNTIDLIVKMWYYIIDYL